uniref:Uncharacterized protein n=1 Tax=Leersia perrieri TaxID=77586 RepID=A0A0D9WQQ3_9ORYZ
MRLAAPPRPDEALLERIRDLHDKLSHAILSLSLSSSSARRRRAAGKQGRCGSWEHQCEEAAAMSDARSLHAVRAALEDFHGHIRFLRNVQSRHVAERDAAVARLQRSRILLATRLAEHRWRKHEVIEETLAFVDNVLDKSRFFSPEDVCGSGTYTRSQSVPKGHGSNLLLHQVAFGKQTPAVQCRRVDYFHSRLSVKNTKEKHLEVLLARG